jgi:5-methylcytosine-specific restriction endonuclease McrA
MCSEIKDETEFHKCKRNKDGLQYHCRKCSTKYRRKYAKKKPEKIKEWNRTYRENHSDQIRRYYRDNSEYFKQYRIDHAEHYEEYYRKNADRLKEYRKQYYRENPHICANAKAKRRALVGDQSISKEDWLLIMDSGDWSCFYCGVKLNDSNRSIDHFVALAKGGDHAVHNLVSCCISCNLSKGDKTYREWKKL